MSKRKKCSFYLFRFLDYQMEHYEVQVNWNKDYGALFHYHTHIYIYIYIYIHIHIYIYIHRHVFRPSQDSSVWLRLTSREQLMSPDWSKHQVLSFAKMLVVWRTNKNYSVLISVLQSVQWIHSERIYPQTRVSSFPELNTVWLKITSRKQLMSPECAKHQVLSFAKMLAVWWLNKKIFCSHQNPKVNVLEV